MNASLQAHCIETTLTQDGTLTLDHLPFQAGETVEVIVLTHALPPPSDLYSLRGTPVRYQEPMEPVAEQDWEVLAWCVWKSCLKSSTELNLSQEKINE